MRVPGIFDHLSAEFSCVILYRRTHLKTVKKMSLNGLHEQDQLILIEALTYWVYDIYETQEEFDSSDPRRNRAAELAESMLRGNDLRNMDFSSMVDPEWSGPGSQ